jgi:hypothetical protein
MTAYEIYLEAARRGLRLDPAGDKLAVTPANLCPTEFADVLRQHKDEILKWLETRTAGLAPDCEPWVHIARQILAGEFDGCDNSTRESLILGLRSITHPLARSSLEKLKFNSHKL